MLISDALFNFVASNGGPTSNIQDITVDTGKGQVLRERVHVTAFLKDVAGLEITAIEGNEGRFFIMAASLNEWVVSGVSNKFQSLLEQKY